VLPLVWKPNTVTARKIHDDLVASGVSCWLFELDSTPGERTQHEIKQRLRAAEKVVVLCSAASLVREGVLIELEELIDDNPDKMVPVSLDDLWKQPGLRVMRGVRDLKPFLIDRNYADFSDGTSHEQAMKRLLRALRRP
jgi:hypothetical protein